MSCICKDVNLFFEPKCNIVYYRELARVVTDWAAEQRHGLTECPRGGSYFQTSRWETSIWRHT